LLRYTPASERAASAVAANPEKSDRVIGDEIGVSDSTVLRARRKSTASHEAVQKRIGKARAPGWRGRLNRLWLLVGLFVASGRGESNPM